MTEAGVLVDEQLAPDLPRVSGDAMLLEQAVMSLIGNAVEAMADGGGTLTLTTGTTQDRPSRRVFAEVRDTGAGIPAANLVRIFEPFFTTKAQGTGLGLATARKFVEAHGGTITVVDARSAGAAFRVTFPVAPAV